MRRAPNPKMTAKIGSPKLPFDRWLKVERAPIKRIRFRKDGNVDVIIEGRTDQSSNLFGFGKKKRKRRDSGAGYMVLDREGLPVHSGRDLPRSEALELAKEARSHGEKGVHLVKTKKTPKAKCKR